MIIRVKVIGSGNQTCEVLWAHSNRAPSMRKRRKSGLNFSSGKSLKRSRMLRESRHVSRAVDVSGVAKVLDYIEDRESLLTITRIEQSQVGVIDESDEKQVTMTTMEEDGADMNSTDFNNEVWLISPAPSCTTRTLCFPEYLCCCNLRSD